MNEPSSLKAVLPLVVFKPLPWISSGGGRGEVWLESSPEARRDLEVMEGRGLKEVATISLEEEEMSGLEVGEVLRVLREDFLTGVEVRK